MTESTGVVAWDRDIARWGAQKRWIINRHKETVGGDRCIHNIGCSDSFTGLYICQNLSNFHVKYMYFVNFSFKSHIYTQMYIYIYVCVCTYICIHMHTYAKEQIYGLPNTSAKPPLPTPIHSLLPSQNKFFKVYDIPHNSFS